MEVRKPVDVKPADPDVGDVVLCQDYALSVREGFVDARDLSPTETRFVHWGTLLLYFRNHEDN